MIALLETLVAEVPEADLLNGLEALRAQDETETAWFDNFSRLLLSFHESCAADRRRAVGLTVLGDTAMDLAARRELDELLAEVCRRARMLLGTDVAYITLTDGNGTFVRATDGVVSEAFRAMRIPLGAGLGGLVARTGEPAFTADYEADDRLVHLPDVDRRVGLERLRAIPGGATTARGRDSGSRHVAVSRGAPVRPAGCVAAGLLGGSRLDRH